MTNLKDLLRTLDATIRQIHKEFGEEAYMTASFEVDLESEWMALSDSIHFGPKEDGEHTFAADLVSRWEEGERRGWPIRRAQGLALLLVENCFGGDPYFKVFDESKEQKCATSTN